MLPLSYTLTLYCIAPLLFAHTAAQSVRAGEYRYLRERFGFYRSSSNRSPIWVHAASVGEVLAAGPLIQSLTKRFPGKPIVVTTATATGGKVARTRYAEAVEHHYLPIDLPGPVARFLAAVKPACALIMETELWLNLYSTCARRKIPVIIVNGRLSSRTLNAGIYFKRLYRRVLDNVDVVLARSAGDKEGFIALGADPQRVKAIGNIKFAASNAQTDTEVVPIKRRYVLAASTHDNEELLLLKMWQKRKRDSHLLVIAPRHPVRVRGILKQIQPMVKQVALRSRDDSVTEQTDLYMIDTLGELSVFMSDADLVFIGGSLVPIGGQNVLEPARLGKAILFGPHMENFADEASILLANQAAVQVADEESLEPVMSRLLESPDERSAMGERAKAILDRYADVAERYTDEITRWCGSAVGH